MTPKEEMENMLEDWAEKHHNEFDKTSEVEKLWNEGIKEMLYNWS